MTYDLEGLGPTGFQELVAALGVVVFGAGLHVMGSGKDGGRDLYFKGKLVWSQPAGKPGSIGEVWDGYTVFQVKQKERLATEPRDNATWLWGEIRKELVTWANPTPKRDPVPDFLVIVSNVPLSAVHESGGHDTLYRMFVEYVDELKDDSRDVADGAERRAKLARLERIKKFRIIDGNQVIALINAHDGVRRAFPALLTAADVFANLSQFTDIVPEDKIGPALRAHARTTLIGDGSIYFDEAGGSDGSGIPIHEVAIDLPITRANGEQIEKHSVINYVMQRGEHMLKPSMTRLVGPRHLVLAGAPGNGKTTVTRFLVQAFRASMLSGSSDLSVEQRASINGLSTALTRFGRELPKQRRWAMRVDLAKHARDYGADSESTLLRYIAERVSKRSDVGELKPSGLHKWMKRWPWFLVLDGLDEVTEPTIRKRVIERVLELANNAEAEDCDLLIVLTTRPMGYVEEIAPTLFERVDLDSLDPEEAVRYGELATRVRLKNDIDRIDEVVTKLRNAAADESMRNLLRTPLQVLIITIILGAAGKPDPARFGLFWTYYEVVLRREQSKPQVGLQKILQEHGQQIQQLHERAGFELQAKSESGERSFATLNKAELESVTWAVLHDAGFHPDGRDAELLSKIMQAATHRLVLITPRGHEGYGFDVRSLQELMAAKHLLASEMKDIRESLRIAAPSPHWRNTWIFAAGGLFHTPLKHQHRAITELVEKLDNDTPQRLGEIVPIGPRLALELVDDGMARALPNWRDRLLAVALGVLQEPVDADLLVIARALIRFADTGMAERQLVADGLRDALSGPATARRTTQRLQALIQPLCDEIGVKAETRGLAKVKPHPGRTAALPKDGWEDLVSDLATSPADFDQSTVADLTSALEHLSVGKPVSDDALCRFRDLLGHQTSAIALQEALKHVIPHEPRLQAKLRDTLIPPIHRAPVAEALRSLTEDR